MESTKPTRSRSSASDGVRSIERALSVLTAFSSENPDQSLGAISRAVSLPRSTTHRLLRTLEQGGFVERGRASGSYRLGPHAVVIGSIAQRTQLLDPRVQETLVSVRDETGETIGLSTLVGRKLLMVAKAESEKALRYSLAAGFMAPAHTCAGGKALLASLSDAELLRLYGDGPIECVTPKTIGTLDVLQADLALARTRGYAIDDEEWGIGLRAIAVPVRGPGGHVSFALSMCAPAARVDLDELLDGARPLHGGAQRLEALFDTGYQPK